MAIVEFVCARAVALPALPPLVSGWGRPAWAALPSPPARGAAGEGMKRHGWVSADVNATDFCSPQSKSVRVLSSSTRKQALAVPLHRPCLVVPACPWDVGTAQYVWVHWGDMSRGWHVIVWCHHKRGTHGRVRGRALRALVEASERFWCTYHHTPASVRGPTQCIFREQILQKELCLRKMQRAWFFSKTWMSKKAALKTNAYIQIIISYLLL